MTKSEKLFHQIIRNLENGFEGKLFGAKCIKSINGKTAAFYWQESMIFKLDLKSQKEALHLNGSKTGSHLYAPDKPMKGWISIPKKHSVKWIEFASKALEYVDELKK